MSVMDRDLGYDALRRELGKMGDLEVVVGIMQDEVDAESGLSVAEYAFVNEFGTDDGHVPERSFMRSSFDQHEAEYNRQLREDFEVAVEQIAAGHVGGKAVTKKMLGRLGLRAERDVRNQIRDVRAPANAKRTLQRKYPKNNPLIDSGRMRQSIASAVRKPGEGGDE